MLHLAASDCLPSLLLILFSLLFSKYASSLQEECPQEPHPETLQQIAARIIQKAWRRYVVGQVLPAAVGTHTLVHTQIKVNRHELKLFFLLKL